MKKTIGISISLLLMLILLTGCTSKKSYTFDVETGDKIKIEFNTSDGYSITSDLPLKIKKDNDLLTEGNFITLDAYNQYKQSLKYATNVKIIEEKVDGNLEYTLYSYNNSEYNYIIKILDSQTGMVLENKVSEETAKECFNRLTITKN